MKLSSPPTGTTTRRLDTTQFGRPSPFQFYSIFWIMIPLVLSSVRQANAYLHCGGSSVAVRVISKQRRALSGCTDITCLSTHRNDRHGSTLHASTNLRRHQLRLRGNLDRASTAMKLHYYDTLASGGSRRRSSSTSAGPCKMTIEDTPLGTTKEGALLLDGLDVYSVPAKGDDHPLTVYGIESENPTKDDIVVLMLHGRTWSSVPVYHLLGGSHNIAGKPKESRSLMEAMKHSEKNIQPYCMDFRGFGGTPRDSSGIVEPNRCVEDVESVLEWIAQRHGLIDNGGSSTNMPALLGWSQGALVAQLVAQKSVPYMSKLILYGSIYDPMIRYPREPLYTKSSMSSTGPPADVENNYDGAIEDFTIEGTIPPEAAQLFAEAALLSDPIKAQWRHLYQFNNCDPARIHVPTLVVAGDQDPYAPLHVQQELFSNLGRGSDRTWSILADADHAVHMLDGRGRFLEVVASFLRNAKQSELHGQSPTK